MDKRYTSGFLILIFIGMAAAFSWFLINGDITLLNPKGLIAKKESDLLIYATLLMLIVIIPVFLLLFFFAWRYREGNTKAKYEPNWEHSKMEELIWWAIPLEIVLVLGALVFSTTSDLDPFKPIPSEKTTVEVQVVAMKDKWLFLYPQEKTATINYLKLPLDHPVHFSITADAPMNSFWIPSLGGMIYAMPGMSTSLNLLPTEAGDYAGSSANYSGEGFSKMKFTASVVSEGEFSMWQNSIRASSPFLDFPLYEEIEKLKDFTEISFFNTGEIRLYTMIIGKFTLPTMGDIQQHTH